MTATTILLSTLALEFALASMVIYENWNTRRLHANLAKAHDLIASLPSTVSLKT
jgi:hypothetical protein